MMYTILDGFDLGVGCLHLFARGDRQRRVMLNAIGPVWDGNEVWLVVVFGALFVGFAPVYATICSAFYTLIMILIMGLMMRAIAIEFRSKQRSLRWRLLWDGVFSIGSYTIAFILGVLLGNVIGGVAIDKQGVFWGSSMELFTPYTILIGIFAITVFMMHGAIYMLLKSEGELYKNVRTWIVPTLSAFILCYILTTIVTVCYKPHMMALMRETPRLFILAFCALLAILSVPYFLSRQ